MITIDVWRTFKWKTLTLAWYARRPDTALMTPSALANAASSLRDAGAAVTISSAKDSLRFGYPWIVTSGPWFFGRRGLPWYFWTWGGRVEVHIQDGKTIAMARGSLAPLFLVPILLSGLSYLKFRQGTIVVAVLLLIYSAIMYLFCSNGLQTTTMAAIAPPDASRAV